MRTPRRSAERSSDVLCQIEHPALQWSWSPPRYRTATRWHCLLKLNWIWPSQVLYKLISSTVRVLSRRSSECSCSVNAQPALLLSLLATNDAHWVPVPYALTPSSTGPDRVSTCPDTAPVLKRRPSSFLGAQPALFSESTLTTCCSNAPQASNSFFTCAQLALLSEFMLTTRCSAALPVLHAQPAPCSLRAAPQLHRR